MKKILETKSEAFYYFFFYLLFCNFVRFINLIEYTYKLLVYQLHI